MFVERRSLLSSEHGYFANIHTQETFTGKGKKLSLGQADGGVREAFVFPVPASNDSPYI